MSADPPPPVGLSHTAAAEPAAAAASAPTAGSKRRASDDAGSNAVESQRPAGSPMDDTPPTAVDLSSTVLTAAYQTPAAASAAHSDNAAATRKKQRVDQSVAAAPAVTTPPWSRLYSDALHSIFKFASLRDLTRLMSVSRRWGEAVMTMPPVAVPARNVSEMQLVGLLNSRARRHVSSLRQRGPGRARSRYEVSVLQLQSISAQTPWLTVLSVKFPALVSLSEQVETVCLALSRFNKLRTLSVSLFSRDQGLASAYAYNRILQAIGGLNPATLHTLKMEFPSRLHMHADLSFAPLAALTQLRRFCFMNEHPCARTPVSLTDAQISQLRALTSVREFGAPLGSSDFFVRMLQPGHALQWRSFGQIHFPDRDLHRTAELIDDSPELACLAITDELAAPLGSLPMLTSLHAHLQCDDVQFFTQLRALTCVKLIGDHDSDQLVASLRHCTQITELRMESFSELISSDLESLLPAFPRLTTVELRHLRSLESFDCFATEALASSLQSLDLYEFESIDNVRLTGLRSLRRLHIQLCSAGTMLYDDFDPLDLFDLFENRTQFPELKDYQCM